MSADRDAVLKFIEAAPRARVLVAGDLMLDAYVSGAARRISPEAPVPVVTVSGWRWAAGGAANVACNIRTLGADARLAGPVGADASAAILGERLAAAGINTDAVIEDPRRRTTTKTRVVAGQQIVRFDEEDVEDLTGPVALRLREACAESLAAADVCVISDYAKGAVTDSFCEWLLAEASRAGKPVVVDPKSPNLARYRGATVVTPNLKEFGEAAGMVVQSEADLARAADFLLPKIAPSALLVTRGGEGMSLFRHGKPVHRVPAMQVEVADVTGAGDTVVAVLAIALAAGFGLEDATGLANLAAGIAVRHPGTWAVRSESLLAECERGGT